ncbi:NUDIX domain-containing protein [soil metagenome]
MSVETPRHSVSVAAAVVDDDGRVLAIRRADNGHWEPPGGVLELSETIHDGLVREVHEETGLLIEPGPLTGVYKNMRRGIVALVFRCTAVNGNPDVTPEAREIRWLGAEDIVTHMDEAYAVRLLDALSPDGPRIRSHDGVALLNALPSSAR